MMNNSKLSADIVAGVVVLYNPEENVTENINSYINQIGLLFIVDNSGTFNFFISDYCKTNLNAKYIFNNCNLGVAAALNIGARKAIESGYSFLLTMDQDSKAAPDMIEKMISVFENYRTIGILSPFHINKFETKKIPLDPYNDELVVQTSGNLLNLSIYKEVGGFKEDFFVDYVDTEFCLRLNQNNYKVRRVNSAFLYHNEADISVRSFLGKKIFPHNHSPFRLYFKTRNRFFLRDLYKKFYPQYFKCELKLFRNMLIKIILFEKDKMNKIRYAAKGYIDYKRNVKYSPFGKK